MNFIVFIENTLDNDMNMLCDDFNVIIYNNQKNIVATTIDK